MKRSQVKWIVCLVALLMLTAAGCEKTPASPSGEGSSTVASQPGEENALKAAAPSETATSQEENSSTSSEASVSASSVASSSSPTLTSSQSNLSMSYTYRPEVARQMGEVDPSNPPDTINVLLTAEASDIQREYTADYFPGCDVTVIHQGGMGGNTTIYPDGSPNPNDPYQVYLTLKINQPGFDHFKAVIQYLDQRQDIDTIGITIFEIVD